jgi:hypothetical protein
LSDMNNKYYIQNLTITAFPEWLDVTHQLESENPPFTLAKNDGVGVLQFSLAVYKSGQEPIIKLQNIQELLNDFALSRELGGGFNGQIYEQPFLTCAKSFISGVQFIRVWYCSNGKNVVLVTYVCEKGLEGRELEDCDKIVSQLQFV